MNSFNKPPFILAFAADQQGCGWHRIMTPLASLVETGVVDGRIDMVAWPDEIALAAKPDTIVWQRPVEDGQIDAMERWRSLLPDTLFVYELDDYLGEIPKASFHSSFMPPDIESRVRRGLAVCDRATTTTDSMAVWLRGLGCADVRVVPNALPLARLKEHRPNTKAKIRVGFAGGMSHAGDLEILRHAMETIGEEVTWVFFGTKPENPACRVEFHEGVPTMQYLDVMATLDVDLYLAPLEDNAFNRCKSNLRLVEAGACGASVVAQNLPTYHVDEPPVFAFASTPEEWTEAIQSFIDTPLVRRQRDADAMRAWVGAHYVLERCVQDRAAAWLRSGVRWKPTPAEVTAVPRHAVVVACADPADIDERMPFLKQYNKSALGLEDACASALARGGSVLWIRPATTLGESAWGKMAAVVDHDPGAASVSVLSSDGINAFPCADRWVPVPPTVSEIIDATVRDVLGDRILESMLPSGPVVVLTKHALSMLGVPDVTGCGGNEEAAMLEWGLRATSKQWKHRQVAGGFASSIAPPMVPDKDVVTRIQARGFAQHSKQPPEQLTGTEREEIELRLLRAQWGGPRPGVAGFGTDYKSWSALRDVQTELESKSRSSNSKSPLRTCTFSAPVQAFGENEWIVFIDGSIRMKVGFEVAFEEAIEAANNDVKIVYSDHDTIVGKDAAPEFKPDFDIDLFLAQDYVTPLCAVRASALTKYPSNRVELYDAILGIALASGSKAFVHIPRILGDMKIESGPEFLALDTFQRQVAVQRRLGDAAEVTASKAVPGCLTVVRDWRGVTTEIPLVSIVVPTLGSGRLIQPCVATILQHTDYPNYEILVVQNGPRQYPELLEATAADPRVRVVRYDEPFNWSAINNWAIRTHARGDYIVTLNDDTCVCTKGWLDAMVGQAVYPGVGVVGAKLVHPAGSLQHVGVVCHRGIAGHMHKGVGNGQAGYLGRAVLTHRASAVTGACMLFSRNTFNAVGGFDESLSHNYNDTVFCLDMRRLGLACVVEMTAELLHPEGTSRQSPFTPEGARLLATEGMKLAALCPGDDPFWNPNLQISMSQGGLSISGLNAEALAWSDFKPKAHAKRVLLVNDLPGEQGGAIEVLRNGDVPISADLSGFSLRLTAPPALNAAPWDIRDADRMARGLSLLGIDDVVLRSLVGAGGAAPPVEALGALDTVRELTSVTVTLDPFEGAFLAPCEGHTPFGRIDMNAWREAFARFDPAQSLAAE